MSTQTVLIHHGANRGVRHPPSSLSGLRTCLEAGARFVEIDVTLLADDDSALLHDARLSDATDGTGFVSEATSQQVRRLRLLWRGQITDEPVALLSDVLAEMDGARELQELQLDLKAHVPLSDGALTQLAELVAPVQSRVRVTSVADWALRRLHALAPGLPLGFDPLLYLDSARDNSSDEGVPPLRTGAYGYRDDHPLATRVWGPVQDYLAARAEALLAQAPWADVWYIRASVLARALDDGFDWIAYLHAHDNCVAAWTLDAQAPGHLALAERLVVAGVDRVTTNDPPALAHALGLRLPF